MEDVERVRFLVSEGRVKEALGFIKSLPGDLRKTTSMSLLEAEALMETGDLHRASQTAERALKIESSQQDEITALSLLGQCAYHEGYGDRSGQLLRRARLLAEKIQNERPELYASVLLVTWRLLSKLREFGSSEIDFSHLRRAVLRSGSPHKIVELRAEVAEMEARKSNPHEALRHLECASDLLGSYPNLWLEGHIFNHRGVVFALLGDLQTAIEWSRRSIDRADVSGHLRVRLAGLINLAEWYRMIGSLEQAEAALTEALAVVNYHVHLRAAALDALTNVYISKGDLDASSSVFCQVLELRRHSTRELHNCWYKLCELSSRARLLEAKARSNRAFATLLRGLRLAQDNREKIWENKFRISLSRLAARLGDKDRAVQHLLGVRTGYAYGPEIFAEACAARASAEVLVGTPEVGEKFQIRGARVAAGLRSGIPADMPRAVSSPHVLSWDRGSQSVLDDAVALIELAGYPHVLAREAFALLETSDAVQAQALITRGTAIRCLAARNWSEAEALAAAKTPGDRLQIVCGTHRDETWEVIAETKPGLHDRCTAVALQKLVDTAVTLDRFRREEKQRAALWPADTMETDGGLWVSEQMIQLLGVARRIAASDITVLLTGETGTGKEVLARAIHRASPRAAKPFIPFNCTAVPHDMLESQLFGYRKGAFTGADAAFDGVIRAAAGGTLFLDEIAEIGPDLQPKLLRFLETHEVHGLGEPQPVKVDVRVLAATNADVETLVAGGRLREDLFYRLNVARLRLPPLRERREEIPPLIECYMRKFAEEQKKGRPTVDDETLEYLVLYPWPGNVRQLVNEISRMIAFVEPDGRITPALLSPDIQASRRTVRVLPGDEPEIRVRLDQPLGDAVEVIEQVMIRRALERSRGNYENAARLLGISRKGLFLKRRRWGLERAS